MEELVWLNGTLCPKKEAKISIDDRGFLFGDGVFETMRSYGSRVFRLDKHLTRLFDSLAIVHLSIPYTSVELGKAVNDTLEANQLQEAYIRLTVTRGRGGIGIDLPEKPSPTIIIVARKFIPYPEQVYREGLKTGISGIKQNLSSSIARIKSLNFLDHILARIEARERGLDEAILLNTEGFVCEGAVSNIFIVRQGSLITPDRESGILPGVTREVIIELALREGIRIEERKVKPSELKEADECFLTNTLMEIMPVSEIDGVKIGTEKPGSLTLTFAEWYKDLVRKEVKIGR
ncbi:MAG: branched-chain-amino-acid transaminase [Proteobacteria bacterium]|nr:branched-chain-amino-acid transaminase [Pseudomonadota bacterium]